MKWDEIEDVEQRERVVLYTMFGLFMLVTSVLTILLK